ncbi:MAG TPA: AraC family transcriptional regulator [Pseudorhodoferax sp.]|nr:AraC family transcriptional regulator [Pseudorhodoferax sp.]
MALPSPSPSLPNAWHYARGAAHGDEVAHWHGASAPALGCHFHREAQLCCVLSGSRLFEVAGRQVHVAAGQGLLIPAGVPHRSLPHVHAGTACVNLYTRAADPAGPPLRAPAGAAPIAELAALAGLGRESFTRRFTQRVGMPPHAYRLAERLNAARERLRAGAAPAELAAELGFADQSHLGRHFRRLFGTSPRAYRDSMGAPAQRSQTF